MSRVMEIATPLGEDVLLFHRMQAREEMSRLSEYQVDLLSSEGDIDVDEILGGNVTVSLTLPDDSVRYFNGYVTKFSQKGTLGRYHRYSAVVRPWLWFLTRTADCRIFQEMTVPDIVRAVFGDHQAADFEVELTGDYRTWNYCVQYRETDFNFVSRLMEHEGIYYYFRHTDGHNTLVITDSTSQHTASDLYEEVPFVAPGQRVRPELEHIDSWVFSRVVQPGVYVHDDYDLERPSVELKTRRAVSRNYQPSDYEVYDYPGLYVQREHGEQYAGVRIDEYGTQFEVGHGTTNAKGLRVGSLFTLQDHPRSDQNREYLILGTSHALEFSGYEAMPRGSGTSYQCTFTAMSSAQQYRPRRSTPKPFVQGPQTAVVVGPQGDEIYTDNYGRVKVQFHWDRYGAKDENSSCWIRVAQAWAGKGWGSVSTPRIGHEVVVDFLEGDPDQPIILGSVHNAENMPPHTGVTSGIRSATHKGRGFNAMTMDDTAGKEAVTIHAQYDMNTTVEHDQTVTVNSGNRTMTIKAGTLTDTVKGDASLTIQAGSRTVSVSGGDYSATASAAVKLNGQASGVEIVGTGGPGVQIDGDPDVVAIAANQVMLQAPDVEILGSGKGVAITANPVLFAHAGSQATIGAPTVDIGDAAITIHGSKITIQGSATISLTSGGSGIELTPGGIKISSAGPVNVTGPVVKINS